MLCQTAARDKELKHDKELQTNGAEPECQTWSRPAPQVRVESQFRKSKFLSQHMAGRMKKFSEKWEYFHYPGSYGL